MQQLDPPRRFLLLLARCAAAIVAAWGVAVILGWVLDNPELRGGFSPGGITVKTNAGIAFFCCGLALAFQSFRSNSFLIRIAHALAAVAMLLGALTLFEHLSGWDLGI